MAKQYKNPYELALENFLKSKPQPTKVEIKAFQKGWNAYPIYKLPII